MKNIYGYSTGKHGYFIATALLCALGCNSSSTEVAQPGDAATPDASRDASPDVADAAPVGCADNICEYVLRDRLVSDTVVGQGCFGGSVAAAEGIVVVGDHLDDEKAPDAGAVHIFEWQDGAWVETRKLMASDAGTENWFGFAVAIFGDAVLVGAHRRPLTLEDGTELADVGAVYVFEKQDGAWAETGMLVAPDGEARDTFGYSIASGKDHVVIGGFADSNTANLAGAAYAYHRDDTGAWQYEGKLTADSPALGDMFGISVAMGPDDTVAVGAYRANAPDLDTGAVYVFDTKDGGYGPGTRIVPQDAAANDWFGQVLGWSSEGNLFSVAFGDDGEGNVVDIGSVYEFVREGQQWIDNDRFVADMPVTQVGFGYAMTTRGVAPVVGAFRDNQAGYESGAIHVFEHSTSKWMQAKKIVNPDQEDYGWFGYAMDAHGSDLFVSAPANDPSGVVYWFEYAPAGSLR